MLKKTDPCRHNLGLVMNCVLCLAETSPLEEEDKKRQEYFNKIRAEKIIEDEELDRGESGDAEILEELAKKRKMAAAKKAGNNGYSIESDESDQSLRISENVLRRDIDLRAVLQKALCDGRLKKLKAKDPVAYKVLFLRFGLRKRSRILSLEETGKKIKEKSFYAVCQIQIRGLKSLGISKS